MSEKDFKNHCAAILLSTAKGKTRSGRVTHISQIGGYNRTKFKLDELLKMYAAELFRFIMNIAMEVPDSEFKRMWEELHDLIVKAASEGELINAPHKRQALFPARGTGDGLRQAKVG